MANLTQNENEQIRHRKIRQKKASTNIDMTPMVDLAFLLLTFFILTTSFRNTSSIALQMPDNTPTKHPSKINESQAFNLILLKDNKVKWYMGTDDKANLAIDASFQLTDTNNLQEVLTNKNKLIYETVNLFRDSIVNAKSITSKKYFQKQIDLALKNPKGIVVLVKANDQAKYESLIKAMDIIQISDIDRYALVDLSPNEHKYFDSK